MVLWQTKRVQGKGTMRLPLLFCLFFAIAGCERAGEGHGVTDDVRLKNVLKAALVEARLIAYDNTEKLSSVADLVSLMHDQGHMTSLLAYGRSNIFFNPQLALWGEPVMHDRKEGAEYAIVVRRNANDYACVTFDGRFFKVEHSPAKWSH